MTWFLIMIAPPLIVIFSIIFVFFWAAKWPTPRFLKDADNNK
ncbi:cytochrome bd oxidase small subunit CydS [Paenalkalicoccus suaedae]